MGWDGSGGGSGDGDGFQLLQGEVGCCEAEGGGGKSPQVTATALMVVVGAILTSMISNQVVLYHIES